MLVSETPPMELAGANFNEEGKRNNDRQTGSRISPDG